MARACNPALRPLPKNPITTQLPCSRNRAKCRSVAVHAQLPAEDGYPSESPKKVQVTQSLRRNRRRGTGARQSLVSVGTSCGGGDQWSSDFDLTLRQLHLDDLVEDGHSDAHVLVHLLVQQIDEQFNTVLRCCPPLGKIRVGCLKLERAIHQYVLSCWQTDRTEIDIDSSIQETIRLTASAKSSCSEACEKPTVVWKYGGNQKRSYSQRWSKLLDLKKTLDKAPN